MYLKNWFNRPQQQESDDSQQNNTASTMSSSLSSSSVSSSDQQLLKEETLVLDESVDFENYQKQVIESIRAVQHFKKKKKNTGGKRAKIKKKLCSLFSNTAAADVNNITTTTTNSTSTFCHLFSESSASSGTTTTNLEHLLEILKQHGQVSTRIEQFSTFLDCEIFGFDRKGVELDYLECKTDIWSEKYDSCLEVNANSQYLLSMKCQLYDIDAHETSFEFSSITFKIDYCKQLDMVDFQVEMKGKVYNGESAGDQFGTTAKAVWNEKKFVMFVNQTKVFNRVVEVSNNPTPPPPLLNSFINEIMPSHYERFNLRCSTIDRFFNKKQIVENRTPPQLQLAADKHYSLKFNNFLQMEDCCLYHGSVQLDFRVMGGFGIEMANSIAKLQQIQFNYFTVKKKKPFVTVEIDNISYLDVCNIIYGDNCEDTTEYSSLNEFISGYNGLANHLRGYLIYTKGSTATLKYKGVGKWFGICPPGLFTFKRTKEGRYRSVFKPSKEVSGTHGNTTRLPEMIGFGEFKFHRNQLFPKDERIFSLDQLPFHYFITTNDLNRSPISNFDFMRNSSGNNHYSVKSSSTTSTSTGSAESQNGLITGSWILRKDHGDSSSTRCCCSFMINGSLNIATVDLGKYGKIWMRPKSGFYDFLNRLFLMSDNKKCLPDVEIVTKYH